MESRSEPRKRKHITSACVNCRRRRLRCDGAPQCAVCTTRGEECIYTNDQDGRRVASKRYVAALESRVRQLEGGSVASESQSPISPIPRIESSPVRLMQGALTVSQEDSIAHYGPSSALMHIQEQQGNVENEDWELEKVALTDITLADLASIAQHLPPDVIPSPAVHHILLSIFLSYLGGWCYWIDDAFLGGLRQSARVAPVRSSHYSLFLHSAILAIAVPLVPSLYPTPEDAVVATKKLIGHAVGMVEDESRRPLVSTVKGLLLLGSAYFQGPHRLRNVGWLYAGMGARTAQILGLHIDGSDLARRGVISGRAKLDRDRTFFTMYTQDILWSFNVGRTATLHTDDYETPLPPIDAQRDAVSWSNHHDSLTPKRSAGPASWVDTTFHWTAKLTILAHSIQESLYRIRPQPQDKLRNLVSNLDINTTKWYSELPPPIRLETWGEARVPPHILNMHAMYHYVRILLHRPTYIRRGSSTEGGESAKACDTAAEGILGIIDVYRKSVTLQFATFTIINIVFTAGTMFLLQAVANHTTQQARDTAADKLNKCIMALADIGWPSAAVPRRILERMRDETPRLQPETQPERPDGSDDVRRALMNPQSDMARMLVDMGWKPPIAAPPEVINPTPMTMPITFDQSSFDPSFAMQADLSTLWGTSMQVPGMFAMNQAPFEQQDLGLDETLWPFSWDT